jgi:hypothetical protein
VKKQQETTVPKTETKTETKPSVEPFEDKALAVMKTLRENDVPITNTLLRDKLALDIESGRDHVRRLMRKLETEGKVKIEEKTVGKRKQYIYRLKE